MNNKSVDIDQLVDFDVFEIALIDYLNDNYSEDYIIEQLRLNINGENRVKKGLRIVNKVIIKSHLNNFLMDNKVEILQALKNKNDKQIILVSLLNTAFSFAFYLQRIFGKFFNVQDVVSIRVIQKEISKVYGGNRVAVNGVYCVGPIFEKAGIYSKEGMGLYRFPGKKVLVSKIAKTLLKESFKHNNQINEIQDYELLDPYFNFIVDVE